MVCNQQLKMQKFFTRIHMQLSKCRWTVTLTLAHRLETENGSHLMLIFILGISLISFSFSFKWFNPILFERLNMNWCVFFLFILNVSYRFGRIAHILTVILYVVDGKYCFEADVIKWTQWGCFKVSKCGCTFNIMQQHHTSAIHAIVHILHSPSTYLSMECIWSQERATAPHKHFAYIIEFMYSVFHVPWTNSQERWYFLVNIYATNCTRTKLQKKANVQFVMCTLCKVHLYISWRANGAILNVWIAFVEWIPVRCNSETD